MWYVILLAATVLVALLLAASRGRPQSPESRTKRPAVTEGSQTASTERAEVRDRLLKLSQGKPPENLSVGAMCYEMVGPPARVDYVCPRCGEKTLYALDRSDEVDRPYPDLSVLQYELPACRRLVEQVKGISLQLDESQFCAHCCPDVENPTLVLLVSYGDEKESHRVEGVTLEDVQLLSEFFSGLDVHAGEMGVQTPLKDYTDRLGKLLGVELKSE